MKGRLQIDFDISPGGRSVAVAGQIVAPNGQAMDVTADVLFCFGLLDYARQVLWDRERKALEPIPGDGTLEIAPAGSIPLLPRANGRRT